MGPPPRSLSAAEVDRFERDGFLSPIDVFDEAEVAGLRARFEAFESEVGADRAVAARTDLHLAQRWAWDVVTNPAIVGAVASVIGPDVLLWTVNWFVKHFAPHCSCP